MLHRRYRELLEKLVAFRTVSTDPAFAEQLQAASVWLADLLSLEGFRVERWTEGIRHPVVFAHVETDPSLPTLLIYGHYDVQPIAAPAQWESDPFELTERDGRLYARGVADNKGQFLIHLAAALEAKQQDRLRYNLKFLLEGEEEIGSPTLASVLQAHKDQLSCDELVISDGNIEGENPTLDLQLRGVFSAKLTLTTAPQAHHSGIYGGVLPNAAEVVSQFVSRLKHGHRVQLPGFYDNISTPTKEQLASQHAVASDHDVLQRTGVKALQKPKTTDWLTQTGTQPALEVTGLSSGYTSDGYANIIPHSAEVRLNFRLVPDQHPEALYESLVQFAETHLPPEVTWRLERTGMEPPVRLSMDRPFVRQTEALLEAVYRHPVVWRTGGGSIPIIRHFQQILGVEPTMINLANADCNMHGPNENFRLDLIHRALVFSKAFLTGRWLVFESMN